MTNATLLLVADAGISRGFTPREEDGHLQPVPALRLEQEVPAGRELDEDRPGRTSERVGESRSAMEPTTGPRRIHKEAFLRSVAAQLDALTYGDEYARVVLVGPPRTLGMLRQLLSDRTRAMVTAEIAKDLTHLGPKQLEEWLQQNAEDITAIPRAGALQH